MTINDIKNFCEYENGSAAINFIKKEYTSLMKECDDETYKNLLRMYLTNYTNYLKNISSADFYTKDNGYLITIKYTNLESITIEKTIGLVNTIQVKAQSKNGLSEYYIESINNNKYVVHNWTCPDSKYKNSKVYKDNILISEKSFISKNNENGKDVTYQYYFTNNNVLYSKRIVELHDPSVKRSFYAYADITDVDVESFNTFDKMVFLNWHTLEREEFLEAKNEYIRTRRKNK